MTHKEKYKLAKIVKSAIDTSYHDTEDDDHDRKTTVAISLVRYEAEGIGYITEEIIRAIADYKISEYYITKSICEKTWGMLYHIHYISNKN